MRVDDFRQFLEANIQHFQADPPNIDLLDFFTDELRKVRNRQGDEELNIEGCMERLCQVPAVREALARIAREGREIN
jgi:hypothetical protein